jgi:hypothetical protein
MWQGAGLQFEVALGGGADEHCESWFISLKRAAPGSSN